MEDLIEAAVVSLGYEKIKEEQQDIILTAKMCLVYSLRGSVNQFVLLAYQEYSIVCTGRSASYWLYRH